LVCVPALCAFVETTTTTTTTNNNTMIVVDSRGRNEDDHARPDRTTMKGMIWNANQVLRAACCNVSPRWPETKEGDDDDDDDTMIINNGDDNDEEPGTTIGTVLQRLFHECVGIVLIQVVEVDLLCSANVGLGVLLAKKKKKNQKKQQQQHSNATTIHSLYHQRPGGGEQPLGYSNHWWSLPTAWGLTRIGWGQAGGSIGGAGGGSGGAAGLSIQDILIFLMDASRLDEALTSPGLHLGGTGTGGGTEGNDSVPHGRSGTVEELYSGSLSVGKSVIILGRTVKGDFVGLSLDGGGGGYLLEPRRAVNKWFYGCSMTPRQIVFPAADHDKDDAPELHVPVDGAILLKSVYDKLEKLTFRPSSNNREERMDMVLPLERGHISSDLGASEEQDGAYEPLTVPPHDDDELPGKSEAVLVHPPEDAELPGTRIIHPADEELAESATLPNETLDNPEETTSMSLSLASVQHDGSELLGAAIVHPEEEEVAEI